MGLQVIVNLKNVYEATYTFTSMNGYLEIHPGKEIL